MFKSTRSTQQSAREEIYTVDLSGNTAKLTSLDKSAGGLPVFSADGSKILFIRLDWITSENKFVGASHRLILMSRNESGQEQLFQDDGHTPTMEYFDW